MRSSSRRVARGTQGFTLVEALATTALMGVAMVTLALIMQFGVGSFNRIKATNEAQLASLIALNRLAEDLTRTTTRSLTLYYPGTGPSGKALAIAFATPMDEFGVYRKDAVSRLPLYQAWLVYYRDPSSNCFLRRRQPVNMPALDLDALPVASVAALTSGGTLAGLPATNPAQILALHVEGFQYVNIVTGMAELAPSNPLRFHLDVGTDQGETVPLELAARIPR